MLTQTSTTAPLSQETAGQRGVQMAADQSPVTTAREITAHVDEPGLGAAERFVAVVGPPAVGKSTVSRALADYLIRKFRRMRSNDFAYIQISLDGGCADSHDQVRGKSTFDTALRNVAELVERGFDTRIICTVNRVNADDCLNLLDIADEIGVSLVKFHVFSVIGSGHGAAKWACNRTSGSPSTNVSNEWRPRTTRGCGISRPTLAASASPVMPLTATAAASAGPSTGSRSSPTAGPTCARSCSIPTYTSRT
ncbi:MAG: hypothetical protein ACRDSZ_15955 [Pseudonocardiaceae bacterium]